jgi:hypothetical protein
MKKEVPTATPLLKSMCRITTRRLVAAQTKGKVCVTARITVYAAMANPVLTSTRVCSPPSIG